jgi:hypothetical protein
VWADRELYKYIKPLDDVAVLGYCKESTAIATRSEYDSVNETFPMNLLLDHVEGITAALAMGEGACEEAPDRANGPTTDNITSADVCAYFTERATLDDVPVAHRPFLGDRWQGVPNATAQEAFSIMRAKLLPLDTLARQAVCAALLGTFVPSTGWPVFSSQLCPEVIDVTFNCLAPSLPSDPDPTCLTQDMRARFRLNMIREARYLNASYDTGMSPLFPNRPEVVREAIKRALDAGAIDGLDGSATVSTLVSLFVSPNPSEISSLSAAVTSDYVNYLISSLQQQQQSRAGQFASGVQAYRSGSLPTFLDDLPAGVDQAMGALVQTAMKQGATIVATAERASALAAYTALAAQSRRITAAMASAMLLVRSLVGLVAGVDVAAKLLPFSVSCMTGILKGVTAFKRLARAAAHSGRDAEVHS